MKLALFFAVLFGTAAFEASPAVAGPCSKLTGAERGQCMKQEAASQAAANRARAEAMRPDIAAQAAANRARAEALRQPGRAGSAPQLAPEGRPTSAPTYGSVAAPTAAIKGSPQSACKTFSVPGGDALYCLDASGKWTPASYKPKPPEDASVTAFASQGATFRPDFRGTVSYAGSYAGQTLIARPQTENQRSYGGGRASATPSTPEGGGSFSLELEIKGSSLVGVYRSSGWLRSDRIYGQRVGGVCKFRDDNSSWVAHCGPDGFFGTATTDPKVIPSVTLKFSAPNVRYATETDRAGTARDTNAEARQLGKELLGAAADAMARKAAADSEAQRASNEAGRLATRNNQNIGACISEEVTYHNAMVRDVVGGEIPGTVRDDYNLISNSCAFALDITMANGTVVTIGPQASFRPGFLTYPMKPKSAKVHLY